MASTAKRIATCFTKEDLKQLEKLKEFFADSPSGVIRRAISRLYYQTFEQPQNIKES